MSKIFSKLWISLLLFFTPPLAATGAETKTAEVQKRIEHVVNSLLLETGLKNKFGPPAQLKSRMAFYHTPGVIRHHQQLSDRVGHRLRCYRGKQKNSCDGTHIVSSWLCQQTCFRHGRYEAGSRGQARFGHRCEPVSHVLEGAMGWYLAAESNAPANFQSFSRIHGAWISRIFENLGAPQLESNSQRRAAREHSSDSRQRPAGHSFSLLGRRCYGRPATRHGRANEAFPRNHEGFGD